MQEDALRRYATQAGGEIAKLFRIAETELERLESEYDLPFISVSQPTENTPAGRMMRRTLANMASFYTEQQGHPRVRVTESDLDQQVLAVFDKMRIEDEEVRDWFRLVLASQTRDAQADSLSQRAELQRQEPLIVAQQDRLLDMRIAGGNRPGHVRSQAYGNA